MRVSRSTPLCVLLALMISNLLACCSPEGAEPAADVAPQQPENNAAPAASETPPAPPSETPAQPARPKSTTLFIIERSKNANVVNYDARLTPGGSLDPDQPVAAYWVLNAEDGRRAELSWIQKKAYGFDIEPSPSGDGYTMTLVPLPERPITVRKADGTVRAEILISGRPAVLEKVYVDSSTGLTGVKVNYIELFGTDIESGRKAYEKVVPD